MLAAMGLVRAVSDSAFAPALLFAIACAIGIPLAGLRLRMPWRSFSIGMIGVVVGAALAYLVLPVLFEDAETNIACVSAMAMRGAPVYPAMNAAARYSLAYGPLTYLAHIPLYWLLGESLVSFKLLGILSMLVTLGLSYRICRHYGSSREALVGVGCLSLVLFRYLHVEFWGRNDPLLLCFTALALWAVVEAGDTAAVLAVALSFAVLPNLKITAVFYVLPILVLLIIQRGWKLAGVAVAIALALFPSPFLLPQVSLAGYIAILQTVGKHGLDPGFLARNLQYSAIFLLPTGMLAWSGTNPKLSRGQQRYLAAIAAGLLGASFAGAKIGAGSYHLLPLAIPVLQSYFWIRSEREPIPRDRVFSNLSVAWALTMLLYSTNFVEAVWHSYQFAGPGKKVIADIRSLESQYRGSTLQVGIGDGFRDPTTFYAYQPVFAGQPYLISGASVRDHQFGGVEIPAATLDDLRNCAIRVWLIPLGRQPFSAQNTYYTGDHLAFGRDFASTFVANYRKAGSGSSYDVWICTH